MFPVVQQECVDARVLGLSLVVEHVSCSFTHLICALVALDVCKGACHESFVLHPLRGRLGESVPTDFLHTTETAIASSTEVDSSTDFSETIFKARVQTD